MRYLKLIGLCGLLLFWGLPLQAAQPMGLYEAEVEVADQGRGARADAMSEAMAAVLVKVNGASSIAQEEVIRSAMQQAARYVRQYRYRTESDKSGKESRLLLSVSFDSNSIDKLLERFGFSVWGGMRPVTLVWLGVEQSKKRVMVGANDRGLVREVLEDAAQRRALPIRLPLLDLTDQSQVRTADIWGGFVDNIEVASRRYETQAILIGKLYPVGRGWESSWTLKYRAERYTWKQHAASVSEAIASGVDGSSDRLSQLLRAMGQGGGEGGRFLLRVEGISDLNDFRRVSDYLIALRGVKSASLYSTEKGSSRFLMEIDGRRETLLQQIELGEVLVRVALPVLEYPRSLPTDSRTDTTVPAPLQRPAGAAEESTESEEKPPEGKEEGTTAESVDDAPDKVVEPPLDELVFRLLS